MYLLDTSVVSAAVNSRNPFYRQVREFLAASALFSADIHISVITLAETQFGGHVYKFRQPPKTETQLAEVDARIASISASWDALPVTGHIARTQARLRADYAAIKIPKRLAAGTGMKGSHIEEWHEAVPPSRLQITENDLWIAATAITHDFELVTTDSDFEDVREASSDLKLLLIR